MIDIGTRIREARTSAGFSQATLAEKIGVVQNAISQYENNVVTPSLTTFLAIADALDVSADYLLCRKEY